jgi:hypothetical protein
VSALLPDGISLADAPFNLANAIRMALVFLSFEEHELKDRPPKSIWLDNDALEAHWAAVRRRWKAGDADLSDATENAAAMGLIVGG